MAPLYPPSAHGNKRQQLLAALRHLLPARAQCYIRTVQQMHDRSIDIADMVAAELVNCVRAHGVSPNKACRCKLWQRNVTRLSPSNMGGSRVAFDGPGYNSARPTLLISLALNWRLL